MPIDPEDAIAGWAQRVEQQTSRTTELSERLQQARASAESPGGEVVVTVDQSGGLADLRLGERAMRLPPTKLAEIILGTSRQAQATLARQVADVVSELYGSDSETAAFIGGVYTAQFPEQDEQGEERDPR